MTRASRRTFLAGATSVLVGLSSAAAWAAGRRPKKQRTSKETKRRVTRGDAKSPFSQAVTFEGLVYCSGVVGRRPGQGGAIAGEFEIECRQALENLKAAVRAAGSDMNSVLKCTCFLTDAADFPTMNRIFRSYFPKDPPARSTVVVKELVVPGARIEIDCVACVQ